MSEKSNVQISVVQYSDGYCTSVLLELASRVKVTVLYHGGLNTEHWNSEGFEVIFSNGPESRRQPFCSVFQLSGP